MDPNVLTGLLGLAGVVLTAIYAPKLDARRKARDAANAASAANRRDDLAAIREEQREFRAALTAELAEARLREAQKDARIDVLEEKLRSVQLQLDMFQAGLAHPPGFILLPRNVWIGLRARLGDQLPPGPFVGEDTDLPPLGPTG